MTIAYRNDEMLGMVDSETGLVDRRIFSDQAIYELELERIFARAWNFMCHDSQIPNPGDFFMTFIGEDRVICVRDNEGMPQVLVNSCRHRGNAVCRAEEGHATSFMCTYHGWTYDLQGALVGVPGFKEVYHEELERENWGLIKAGKVETHKGFIFATMDAEAPDLEEYLGDAGRLGLALLAERGDEMVAIPGIQKYTIPCNWKFAVDNVWDYYHGLTHMSAQMSGFSSQARRKVGEFTPDHLVFLGEYGHVLGGPRMTEQTKERFTPATETLKSSQDEAWRERPAAKQALGPIGTQSRGHTNIFPNMWIAANQVSMRMPKGPGHTEIWWWTVLDKNQPATTRNGQTFRAAHTFGPAGMLEQDDGENWGQSTRGMVGSVSRDYRLNYSMSLNRGEIINDELSPPRIQTQTNEHPQLWHYRAWSEWMSSSSWQELKATHSQVPLDRV